MQRARSSAAPRLPCATSTRAITARSRGSPQRSAASRATDGRLGRRTVGRRGLDLRAAMVGAQRVDRDDRADHGEAQEEQAGGHGGARYSAIVKTCPIQPLTSNVPERTKPWRSYHATSGGAPAQQSTRRMAAPAVARLLDRRGHEQGADAAAGVPARGHERLDVALGLVDAARRAAGGAQDERAERRRVGILRDAKARAVRPRLHVPDRAGTLRPRRGAPLVGLSTRDEPDDGLVEEREQQRDVGGGAGTDADGRHAGARYRPAPLVTPALEVQGLAKRYGATSALRGVDLTVAEAELVGLLGPNGAGKSTLVKSAAGLVRPRRAPCACAAPPPGRTGAPGARLSGRALPLPRMGHRRRAAAPAPAPRRLGRRRGRARRAAGAGRARRRGRAPGRGDVEGHAAAPRDRAGADRRAAPVAARRAHERAGPRRAADRARPAGRAAPARGRRAAQHPSAQRGRARLRPRGDHRPRRADGRGAPGRALAPARRRGRDAAGTQRFEGATRDDVPAIVERLVAAGERIYDVRLVRSSLEDAYLAVVEPDGP